MGRSTFDIPTSFLRLDQRIRFLDWIASIPTNESAKRGLLSTWAEAVKTQLTRDDYARAIPKS